MPDLQTDEDVKDDSVLPAGYSELRDPYAAGSCRDAHAIVGKRWYP